MVTGRWSCLILLNQNLYMTDETTTPVVPDTTVEVPATDAPVTTEVTPEVA
jgi:hypothetical protein